MQESDIFILAQKALIAVVNQIKDDQWNMAMPQEFMKTGQDIVTLRQIINYHAHDDAWVPYVLAGKTMEVVGSSKFEGDLLKEDPKGKFNTIAKIAMEAVQAMKSFDIVVHTSFGDYPVESHI